MQSAGWRLHSRDTPLRCVCSVTFRPRLLTLLASAALVVFAINSGQTQPEPAGYTIQGGDTLSSIARQHGCSVAELRAANELTGDAIYAGRTLVIPVCEPPPAVEPQAQGTPYEIQPGDFLERIAAEHGCSVAELMLANDLQNDVIYAGGVLAIPTCSPREADASDGGYVIQPGDYLAAIGRQFGCSVAELRLANSLSGDLIRAGDRLTIPECTGRPRRATRRSVDSDSLPRLMEARGFRPPRRFRGLVVEISFNSGRRRVVAERWFDYGGTAVEDDWNPASTVKLYAAVAAMQRVRALGFSGNAAVTFHGNRREHTFQLSELVQEALTPSNNIAYNFLVQFVGFDEINRDFFNDTNGFSGTAVRRAYARRDWMELGESPSFRNAPALTIVEAGRSRRLDTRTGTVDPDCSGAACTTLADLAECMRRLMLQEQLDPAETYRIPRRELLTIRLALRADRLRGEEVVQQLASAITGENVYFYHKAGFAGRWYSDVVYVYDPTSSQAWIVALAGYPGRDSLNDAARLIGEIIAAGEL